MGRPKLQPRGVAHGLSERTKKEFRYDQMDECEGSKVAQRKPALPSRSFIYSGSCDCCLWCWAHCVRGRDTHTHRHTLFNHTKFQINLPETGNLWGWSYKGHQRLLSSCHIVCVSIFLLKDRSAKIDILPGQTPRHCSAVSLRWLGHPVKNVCWLVPEISTAGAHWSTAI